MSEQQSQTASAVQETYTIECSHPEAVGKRWGDPISEERQAELQGYLDRWQAETYHGKRPGPFADVRLTGADVCWYVQRVHDAAEIAPDLYVTDPDIDEAHQELLPLVNLEGIHLEGALLYFTHLEGAVLLFARLEDASLDYAHLERAYLDGAHLEGAELSGTHLEGADMRQAFLSEATVLSDTSFSDTKHGSAILADVHWGDANLALMNWSHIQRRFLRRRLEAIPLGEEQEAWRPKDERGKKKKGKEIRLGEFANAVRVNRQVATVLRRQGLNADAERYAYKAQVLERQVFRRQGRRAAALGSWFLDLISGYGYRPMRSLITYALVVLAFATAYFILGSTSGHALSWNEAIVISMTAFHGRGFFSTVFQPGDLQAAVAAVEAFIGLLIEIVFIATFTNRFFAR